MLVGRRIMGRSTDRVPTLRGECSAGRWLNMRTESILPLHKYRLRKACTMASSGAIVGCVRGCPKCFGNKALGGLARGYVK